MDPNFQKEYIHFMLHFKSLLSQENLSETTGTKSMDRNSHFSNIARIQEENKFGVRKNVNVNKVRRVGCEVMVTWIVWDAGMPKSHIKKYGMLGGLLK